MTNLVLFLAIFLLGELIINRTVFRFLKNYFQFKEGTTQDENPSNKPILGLPLSVVKGLLERFTIYFSLVAGLSQILIVFGALKIGTRLDKTKEITNDYFLLGNFVSILVTVGYYVLYLKLTNEINMLWE